MILSGGSQLSYGENLNCGFTDKMYELVGSTYTCYVTSYISPHSKMIITQHTGTHMANKNINDVKSVWIQDPNTKYIPANLGSLFNLTNFAVQETQLFEVIAKDFQGMEDLVYLSFYNNKLTYIPSDAFNTLTKLRMIYLGQNQIIEMPVGIISNNLDLELIYFNNNQIKFIGSGLFDGLTKMKKVDLSQNICVSKTYTDTTGILQLKHDLKTNCINPNEAIDLKLNVMMKLLLEVIEGYIDK